MEGIKRPPSFAFKISKKIWKNKWSPFGILRKGGSCITVIMMNRFVKNRIKGELPENELNDYKEYMKHILVKPGSTEYALFVCFDHYLFSTMPLDDVGRLKDSKLPISFYYGDRDWMSFVGNHDVLQKNPYKGSHSHRFTISKSDHHLYFDNPVEFVEVILQDLSNLHDIEKFILQNDSEP